MSLDVTAAGVPGLVDPGITSYAPDPLTDHYRSALAHNVILVGHKGPDLSRLTFAEKTRPAGEDFHWRSAGPMEAATGLCRAWRLSGEGEATVCRSVIFVEGRYWIVRDLIEVSGEHEVTACWQFFPGRVEMELETSAAEFVDARGRGIKLLPLLGSAKFQLEIAAGLTCPPRGWVSVDGADIPATSLNYGLHVENRATLIWLLIPCIRRSASGVKAARSDGDDRSVTIAIDFPDRRKHVITLHPPRLDLRQCLKDDPHGRIVLESREGTISWTESVSSQHICTHS
jgi:hypothetical protein